MADMSGALLLRHGIVRPEQLAEAQALKQRDGGSFGECLVRIGAIEEEDLVSFYHKRLMIPRVTDAKLLIVSPKVLGLVTADMAAEFRVVPVEVDAEGTITLAMSDPTNNHAVDEVAFFADRYVVRAVGTESAIRRAIETHYGVRFTSPRASDRLKAKLPAPEAAAKTVVEKKPAEITKKGTIPVSSATPPLARQPESAKPSLESLDKQVVLLTRVKRSEETPLPMPVPPPDDYTPEHAHEEISEPILLTKPKEQKHERRDTLPGFSVVLPDPPLNALKTLASRDEIAQVVLEYMGQLARRTLFFVIKKSLLVGHDARGELGDPALTKQLAINIDAPSIFRDVIASRLPYRGPLPETAANRIFAQSLGGVGSEVLLMPIAIRERIIAVLFADHATVPLPDAALHATTREAGLAYERLILHAKGALTS